MSLQFFITGTDTGVGKTYISVALLQAFKQLGFSSIALKPIASGSFYRDGILYHPDALALSKHASITLDYQTVNPFCFYPAIAPHLAASKINLQLSVKKLSAATERALSSPADIHLIEGAGGWHVPLNAHETMADYVQFHLFRVVLIVGIRLGCLNHALLTYEAIRNKNVTLSGWVANCLHEEETETEGMIETLKSWLHAPFLGKVDYGKKPQTLARNLI